MDDTKLSTEALKALLESQGIKLSDAAKVVRSLNKEVADQRAAEFEAKKSGNRESLLDIMESTRSALAESFADLLPGTHANFTVRVSKEGDVIATANDCHASGYRDSLHVTPAGDIVEGEEGAALAKNVRPRKTGE